MPRLRSVQYTCKCRKTQVHHCSLKKTSRRRTVIPRWIQKPPPRKGVRVSQSPARILLQETRLLLAAPNLWTKRTSKRKGKDGIIAMCLQEAILVASRRVGIPANVGYTAVKAVLPMPKRQQLAIRSRLTRKTVCWQSIPAFNDSYETTHAVMMKTLECRSSKPPKRPEG